MKDGTETRPNGVTITRLRGDSVCPPLYRVNGSRNGPFCYLKHARDDADSLRKLSPTGRTLGVKSYPMLPEKAIKFTGGDYTELELRGAQRRFFMLDRLLAGADLAIEDFKRATTPPFKGYTDAELRRHLFGDWS